MNINIQQMMKQAQKMQSGVQKVKKQMEEKTIKTSTGGGAVTIERDCSGDVRRIHEITIDPSVISEESPEEAAKTLADLILAALKKSQDESDEEFSKALAAHGLSPELLKGSGLF